MTISEETVMRNVFREFDSGNGLFTSAELQAMLIKLQIVVEQRYLDALLRKFDRRGDGVIEFIGSQFGLGYGMKIWQSGERTLSIAGRAGSGVFTNYFTVFDTGKINMSNLPTSSAGLSSGDIYVAAGVLMIV